MSELRATIGERAGAIALPQAPDELDPLPSVLPPEGVVVTRLSEIASRPDLRIDVADVRGGADAAVIATLASVGREPIVAITEDADAARRLAADVLFLLGRRNDAGDVLHLTMPES